MNNTKTTTSAFLINRRQIAMAMGAMSIGLGWSGASRANGPVRFILPVSAGSGVDAIARAAGNQLGVALGAPVVIENQPGAGGVVGTQALVKAAPDGQTLSLVSNNHVIYPAVIKSLSFDPIADITPISIVATSPLVIVTRPGFPAKNLTEFRNQLKANPGKFNFGSAGNGTILHLAAELFKDVTGVFSTHIPYRGTGPLVNDLMGGQVDWAVIALPAIRGLIENGRLQALAVGTQQRVTGFPQLPTAVEQGFDKYVVEGWVAAVGPKGMSPDLVARTHAAIVTAFSTTEVKDSMAKQGNTIVLSSPEAAAAHFKSELVRYAALVKKSGMVAQ
ncbi:tripartite tricarboxylate transporter receptor family protein [Hydrogenophaga sp. RAC07]|uniref:Bug family tripartite tricarboxylate transporter substrate binding protein n=1 Tax=Hydrogenophaga sp. RAC07 TaxID=1842537 RepID=UPI00083CED36|nr:tripartite tricarboxylate transporter substrate-binding protein [Hydrogenophaga sp. RAC07]AOF86295.1 tripartite tricarboxylate transporter receptor family protein [Hydrogenophaga sp. RAC07]